MVGVAEAVVDVSTDEDETDELEEEATDEDALLLAELLELLALEDALEDAEEDFCKFNLN